MANQLFSLDECMKVREPMPMEPIRMRIIGVRIAPSSRNPQNCTCLITMVPVNPKTPEGDPAQLNFRRIGVNGMPITSANIVWNRTFPNPAATARKVLDAKIKAMEAAGEDTSEVGLTLADFHQPTDDKDIRATAISLDWWLSMMNIVDYPKNCRGKRIHPHPSARNLNTNAFFSIPESYEAPSGSADLFGEMLNGSLQHIGLTLSAMNGQELVIIVNTDDNNYHVVINAYSPESKEAAIAGLNALPMKDAAQILREVANDGVSGKLSAKDLLDEVMSEEE